METEVGQGGRGHEGSGNVSKGTFFYFKQSCVIAYISSVRALAGVHFVTVS